MSPAALPVRKPSKDDDPEGGRMSFLEHLEELRKRLIRSCLALLGGMGVAFFFMEPLTEFVLAPTRQALPPGSDLIFIRPTEGIATYFDIALIGGLVLAAPLIMYQVWMFVVPALYANERRYAFPFVALAGVGTVAGAAFAHYALYPTMMNFLGTFTFGGIRFMPRLEDAFTLYLRLMIAMVAVFQIPTLSFVLARLRLVTARFLWLHMKHAVLLMLIAAAILTPSADPWNQFLFAAPMFALYLIGIVVAWLAHPKNRSEDVGLRLVFTAAVIDHAWHRQQPHGRRSGRGI